MRILHVWDQAGVACLMAKYQRKLGHEALVVVRDGYDGLKQKAFYGVKVVGMKKRKFRKFKFLRKPLYLIHRTINVLYFYLYVAWISRHFDVVHIHSVYLVSFFLPFKPKIVEFHGDDARRFPSKKWRIDKVVTRFYLKHFNKRHRFFVSTPDLLRDVPNSRWIPNPVDVEHFNPKRWNVEKKLGTALYSWNWYEIPLRAELLAKDMGLKLYILNRKEGEYVLYKDFPRVLGRFEYYIDRYRIRSLSKTALEALVMGLKVIDWEGKVIQGFPEEHHPLNVAKRTIKIYEEVLGE